MTFEKLSSQDIAREIEAYKEFCLKRYYNSDQPMVLHLAALCDMFAALDDDGFEFAMKVIKDGRAAIRKIPNE